MFLMTLALSHKKISQHMIKRLKDYHMASRSIYFMQKLKYDYVYTEVHTLPMLNNTKKQYIDATVVF